MVLVTTMRWSLAIRSVRCLPLVLLLEAWVPAQVSVMPFFPRCRGKSSFQSFTLFIWDTFEDTNGSRLSTYVNMWVMTLIVLSAIVGACIETNAPIHKEQVSRACI
jgi:hypothetical protein